MSNEETAVKSIEERLGDALGIDDDIPLPEDPEAKEVAQTEEIDDAPEPIDELEPVVEGNDSVELEIDGTIYTIPKTLEDKFLFQKDYTQKTQSLSDQRKQVEVQQKQVEIAQSQQKFLGEIQPELSTIGYLNAQIAQLGKDLQENVNTLSSDQLFKKKIELDGMKEQQQALSMGLQEKYRGFEEAQQQSVTELLELGSQVLKTAIPDWTEDKQKDMRAYALAEGYSEHTINTTVDPIQIKTLWKAAQWDKLQSGVKGAVQQVKNAPTIQPTARANAMPTDVKRKLKLHKRLNDPRRTSREKADDIIDEMGDRFG